LKEEEGVKWSDLFRRVRNDGLDRPSFYLKGSREWLYTYDGYMGGMETLDEILELCERRKFVTRRTGSDSPMGISTHETFIAFLDGGLEIFEGNSLFVDPSQGAYVRGFNALRWLLCQLGIPQPRRLKGEEVRPDCDRLEALLEVAALPFVNTERSKPG